MAIEPGIASRAWAKARLLCPSGIPSHDAASIDRSAAPRNRPKVRGRLRSDLAPGRRARIRWDHVEPWFAWLAGSTPRRSGGILSTDERTRQRLGPLSTTPSSRTRTTSDFGSKLRNERAAEDVPSEDPLSLPFAGSVGVSDRRPDPNWDRANASRQTGPDAPRHERRDDSLPTARLWT